MQRIVGYSFFLPDRAAVLVITTSSTTREVQFLFKRTGDWLIASNTFVQQLQHAYRSAKARARARPHRPLPWTTGPRSRLALPSALDHRSSVETRPPSSDRWSLVEIG